MGVYRRVYVCVFAIWILLVTGFIPLNAYNTNNFGIANLMPISHIPFFRRCIPILCGVNNIDVPCLYLRIWCVYVHIVSCILSNTQGLIRQPVVQQKSTQYFDSHT